MGTEINLEDRLFDSLNSIMVASLPHRKLLFISENVDASQDSKHTLVIHVIKSCFCVLTVLCNAAGYSEKCITVFQKNAQQFLCTVYS